MSVWELSRFLLCVVLLLLLTGVASAQEVWINKKSGVYHCQGTHWFANTINEKLILEREARLHGYRPAYGRSCFAEEGSSSRQL